MNTLAPPTAHYMSTLNDEADQIMHAAATILGQRIIDGELGTNGITYHQDAATIDPWKLHDHAIEIYKQIRPQLLPVPGAAISDTEVRYTVMDVVVKMLVDAGMADTYDGALVS